MNAVTGDASARVQTTTGARATQLVEPLADYYVGRLKKDFLSGRAKLAIVVPTDFSKRLFAGRDAPVQILVDGSDANTAVQAAGNAARMAAAVAADTV